MQNRRLNTVYKLSRAFCEGRGTRYFFNCHAEHLITDIEGAVKGAVIYNNETDEYGRDSKVLFPLDNGPYYVQVIDKQAGIGKQIRGEIFYPDELN